MRIAYAVIALTSAACGRFGDYDIDVRPSTLADNGDSDAPAAVVWEDLGVAVTSTGISNRASGVDCAQLAAGASGTVYVAWTDASSGNNQVYVRAYTDAWAQLAGSADGSGISNTVTGPPDSTHATCSSGLAIDGAGNLYATWQDYNTSSQAIYLLMWNGAAWSALGGSASGGGISGGAGAGWWPSVAIDSSGRPVVSYEQVANPYVVRWDGAWSGVGTAGSGTGVSTTDGVSFIPNVAAGSNDELFVTWGEHAGADNLIYAAHWTASAGWTRLGGALGTTSADDAPPLMLVVAGVPTVYWPDGDTPAAQIHIVQWDGASWQPLAVPMTNGSTPAAHVDNSGHIVMSWTQQDGAVRQIHAAWFDGTSWQSLDPTGGSISQASSDADGSDLAIDGSNRAVIIWRQDNGSGAQGLYGRRTVDPIAP